MAVPALLQCRPATSLARRSKQTPDEAQIPAQRREPVQSEYHPPDIAFPTRIHSERFSPMRDVVYPSCPSRHTLRPCAEWQLFHISQADSSQITAPVCD